MPDFMDSAFKPLSQPRTAAIAQSECSAAHLVPAALLPTSWTAAAGMVVIALPMVRDGAIG